MKTNHGRAFFDFARQFESAAYARELTAPAQMSAEQRGLISVILDFHGIDRKTFFDSMNAFSAEKPAEAQLLKQDGSAEGMAHQTELGMEPTSLEQPRDIDESDSPSESPILPKTNVGKE